MKEKFYIFTVIFFSFILTKYAFSITEVGGYVYSNTTWTLSNSPYIVKTDLIVNDNATLSIEPGVNVLFNQNTNLIIKGNITAIGNIDNEIIFSSNAINPVSPNWGSIKFESKNFNNSSIMRNCIIQYSGKNGCGPIVLNCISEPELSSVELKNNKYNGLQLVGGIYNQDLILSNIEIPYFTLKDIQIESGFKLILNKQVVLKLSKEADIIINGELTIKGEIANNCIITSFTDDNSGNYDTNGDGNTSPKPFDWGGIYLSSISKNTSSISNAIIKYGGGSSLTQNSLLYIQGVSSKIEFTEFAYSGFYGVTLTDNASPDFGGGDNNSEGYNKFTGFLTNYAFVNKSKNDIYAKYNCWDTESLTEINKKIYDKNDKSTYGQVVYNPYNLDCSPKEPEKVTLLEPDNNLSELDTNLIFKWKSVKRAKYYELSISSDLSFDSISTFNHEINDTIIIPKGISPNTKYFWKVRAKNLIGVGEWSEVFSLTTFDTTKPNPPELINPSDLSNGHLCTIMFIWFNSSKTNKYWLQIAEDSLFNIIAFDDNAITDTTILVTYLKNYMNYYCRIASYNRNGYGEWSEIYFFTTSDCPMQAPPKTWIYEKQTGENSFILLNQEVNQDKLKFKLSNGDAVGVFYSRDGNLTCGGYSIWKDSVNIPITTWGDNIQTEIKDGFLSKEKYRFKIWYSKFQIETPVAVEYSNNLPFFIPDTFSVVKSFTSLDSFKLKLQPNKWQMVSSPIAPYNSSFSQIFNGDNLAISNAKEIIFYPDESIHKNYDWNYQSSYEVIPFSDYTGIFIGEYCLPEQHPIIIQPYKWNMLPFYSLNSMPISEYLNSISSKLLIAKDSKGSLYSPKFNYNTFDSLTPGSGIKVFTTQIDTLLYIKNSVYNNILQSNIKSKYFINNICNTGNNSTIIINCSDADDEDEIGIYNFSDKIYGSGVFENNKCIITLWGDNDVTDSIEGALNNEELKLKLWKRSLNKVYNLKINSITNLATTLPEPAALFYNKDGILFIDANITSSSIEQSNIDNDKLPDIDLIFNGNLKEFSIKLRIYSNNVYRIDLYNSLGQKVNSIINNLLEPNIYCYNISTENFYPGIYFVVLSSYNLRIIKKLIIF